MPELKYLRWPLITTAVGLLMAVWVGWRADGTLGGALSFFFVGAVLAVLEISLSFDNAIVNANKLKHMTPIWRRRFLTWGILIAVFGMRIVFPLAVVAIAAEIGPIAALRLAAVEPQQYSQIMKDAHLGIAAFGGAFLMMVGLNFFIDQEKEIDWIDALETRLRRYGSIRGFEIALTLFVCLAFAWFLPIAKTATFLFAAIAGLLTFLLVDAVGQALDRAEETMSAAARGGAGAFLYLEVLDASFSFDGVIGAFALTSNLFLIAIGLGIGAMYVRSMTIMLVDRGTLTQFRYLEHGAFYSILALSVLMFAQSLTHVPEAITGLLGAGLIGLALYSSIQHNKAQEKRRLAAADAGA